MGTLTVSRAAGGWRDRARAYAIEIDGETVGKIKRGESVSVEIGPGSHAVRAAIDWCSSPTVIVQGDRDERLTCAPGGNAFLAVIDMLFRPGEYISLRRS